MTDFQSFESTQKVSQKYASNFEFSILTIIWLVVICTNGNQGQPMVGFKSSETILHP